MQNRDLTHNLGALLRARRAELGWTLAQVAGRAGMAGSYLSMIETGRVAHPPAAARLRALAKALEMDAAPLLAAAAWEQTPPQVREHVARLEDRVRATGPELARLPSAPGRAIPLVNKVAAGLPDAFTDLDYPARAADDYLNLPSFPPADADPAADDPDLFAARVTGQSMLPDYKPGDIVVFSAITDPAPGTDCFVRLEPDHHTTFKRVFFDTDAAGTQLIRLQPLNPSYPPRIVPREQVAGLYRAVWRVSRV